MCMDGFMFGSCCVHDTADNMISEHQQTTSKVSENIVTSTFILELESSEISGHDHHHHPPSHQKEDNLRAIQQCFIQQRLLPATETAPKV